MLKKIPIERIEEVQGYGKVERVAIWLRSGCIFFKKAEVGYDLVRKGRRLDCMPYLLLSSTCLSVYT
jgi:hypothetical protein